MKKITKYFSIVVIILGLIVAFVACQSSKKPDLGLIPVKSADKWQYIDKEGNIIINPQYSYAAGFFDGLALIRNTDEPQRYGFINDKGTLIINTNYVGATSFSEGLACVVKENGSPTYIDLKGQIKFTLKDAQIATCFKEGYAAFSQFDKDGQLICGYIDITGKVKIIPQFYGAFLFSEGLAAVKNKDSKWGFIDVNGKVIINYQFKEAGEFKDGLCVVSDGKNWGYIDKTGIYTINPQFEGAFAFSEVGLALVKMDRGKFGFINKSGKIIINPQFDDALGFTNIGRAPVANAKKWGYIDTDGKYVINPQFDYASNFFGKIAFIKSNGKVGLINKDGIYLINPQYDDINYDVLLGEMIDLYVKTDYFNSSTILSFVLPYTEFLNSKTKVGNVIEKLKNIKKNIIKNIIAVDTTLAGKTRVILEYFSNTNIKISDYYQGNIINTSAPINQLNFFVILPKPKGKVLFESLKSQILSKPPFIFDKGKSKDNKFIYNSDNQSWTVYLKNDENVWVYISTKAEDQMMRD
jgi:hypothetical protein